MIYYEFSEEVQHNLGVPPIMCFVSPYIDVGFKLSQGADRIFDIKYGVTSYYKDRYGTSQQFTPEDEVVLRLKAVLI